MVPSDVLPHGGAYTYPEGAKRSLANRPSVPPQRTRRSSEVAQNLLWKPSFDTTYSNPGEVLSSLSGQCWPNSGQNWSNSGQRWSKLGKCWSRLDHLGHNLTDPQPNSARLRHNVGRKRHTCGRFRPELAELGHNGAQIGAHLARVRPNSMGVARPPAYPPARIPDGPRSDSRPPDRPAAQSPDRAIARPIARGTAGLPD